MMARTSTTVHYLYAASVAALATALSRTAAHPPAAHPPADPGPRDRGDVPGWVMITMMTA